MDLKINDVDIIKNSNLIDLVNLLKVYRDTYKRDYPDLNEFIKESNNLFLLLEAKEKIFNNDFLQNIKIAYNDLEYDIIYDKENIFTKEQKEILEKINFLKEHKITEHGKELLKSFFSENCTLDMAMEANKRLQEYMLLAYLK